MRKLAVPQAGTHDRAMLVQAPGDLILVAGATGGVGQILTTKLLDVSSCLIFTVHLHVGQASEHGAQHLAHAAQLQRGYKVRARTRSAEKAKELLGEREGLNVVVADARQPETLHAVTDGVAAVAAVTGTTAFPSKRCYPVPAALADQWRCSQG